MTRGPAAAALPPPPAVALEVTAPRAAFGGSLSGGWQALRRRWACLGPDCGERYGIRAWCKLPARVQLQEGWCCSPECFEAAFELQARRLIHAAGPRPVRTHRIPLGLLLLSHGLISQAQLRDGLEAQKERGGRLGEWLVRQGAVGENEIAATIGMQWARPTFPLADSPGWQACRDWVPLAANEVLGMLPLYFAAAQRRLYVGFTQVVDFNALAAVGDMLGCATEACIVADGAWEAAIEHLRTVPGPAGVESIDLEEMDSAAEIAGVARQYARYAEARQVRMAAIGPFLWVRIRGQRVIHLTFRPRRRAH
ncbi:MAG: hypothetical protein ACRD1C_02245 [Terriglobales bacterium]